MAARWCLLCCQTLRGSLGLSWNRGLPAWKVTLEPGELDVTALEARKRVLSLK